MHSLRTKNTLLTIIAILVSVLVIGVMSILSIQRAASRISTQYMNEICLEKADGLNHFLGTIEQDVEIAIHYLTDDLDVVALAEGGVIGAVGTGDSLEDHDYKSAQQKELDTYLTGHVSRARELFHSIAYNTNNALTYFYQLNPELSRSEKGFLYIRPDFSDFQEINPMDILAYDETDEPHVGWYYQALDKGRPTWLPPYEDANLGFTVTSYIAPIYKAGTFIGMAGMDVSYERLVEKVQDLDIYRSGYAFLTDEYGKIIYHPTIAAGTMLSEVNTELKAEEAYLNENEDSSSLVNYSFDGVPKRAAWRTLSNGLRLFVSAPVSEIEESWQALILEIIVTALILVVIFVILTTIIIGRVTNPLKKLTKASQQIMAGNYDVDLPYEGKDEVGTLTRSFRHLTEHLKVYVSDLNSKAYKDALTNVKNKAAMDIYVSQIDELPGEEQQYAVLLFDCNNLKVINDQFGHEKGDIYLQTACDLICRAFPRSPVFRMGGDEFVVVLQKESFRNRMEQIAQFKEMQEQVNQDARNPWDRADVAHGVAVFDRQSDTCFAEVLKRADEQMYQNKKIMKAAAENA